MTAPFTPEQEARVREIVEEIASQAVAMALPVFFKEAERRSAAFSRGRML